jgi:predicted amidohydrolase
MKVAAVQFAPMFKRPDTNIPALVRLVRQAASQGAQLVVLPELCTTGYGFMSPEEAKPFGEDFRVAYEPSMGRPGQALLEFTKLVRELNISLVFGFVEWEPGAGKLYNSQAYLDAAGTVVRYQKVNFFGNDWLWASHGIANPPVVACPIEGKRVGLLICRDVRNKVSEKWAGFYESGDCDVVALSTAWGDGGFPATAWMDFVESTKTALVVSNRYGQEGPNNFGEGGVCVIGRDQKVQCQGLVWEQDCIVYGEV